MLIVEDTQPTAPILLFNVFDEVSATLSVPEMLRLFIDTDPFYAFPITDPAHRYDDADYNYRFMLEPIIVLTKDKLPNL